MVFEKIKVDLTWEKNTQKGGKLGFSKNFFNTTNSSTIEANIMR